MNKLAALPTHNQTRILPSSSSLALSSSDHIASGKPRKKNCCAQLQPVVSDRFQVSEPRFAPIAVLWSRLFFTATHWTRGILPSATLAGSPTQNAL
jgi:hypothetical protein